MRVVGHDEHGHLGRGHGEQFQRGQRDPVQVGQDVLVQAERRAQQVALFPGQPGHQPEDRPQELVQPGERHPGLGSHPAAGQRLHLASRREPLGLRQQGRLADARLAVQQQGGAGTGRRPVEQGGHDGYLALTAQHRRYGRLIGSGNRRSRSRATHSAQYARRAAPEPGTHISRGD